MAIGKFNILSSKLGFTTSFNVLLPDSIKPGEKVPVLYLLHGLSDDHNAWLVRTSIEMYVLTKKIAVIMPEVQKSFYLDMYYGDDYYSYISSELPEIAGKFFPVDLEQQYVAGLSMGGYGALKVALCNPDKYKAVGSFSGVTDMASYVADFRERNHDFYVRLFGPDLRVKDTSNDLFYVVKNLKGKVPSVYLSCGTEDFLYSYNVRFRELCTERGIPLKYHEEPASHTWSFWDRQIKSFLDFIGI